MTIYEEAKWELEVITSETSSYCSMDNYCGGATTH